MLMVNPIDLSIVPLIISNRCSYLPIAGLFTDPKYTAELFRSPTALVFFSISSRLRKYCCCCCIFY